MYISDIESIDPSLAIQVEIEKDNSNWQHVREYNMAFVESMMRFCEEKLRRRGYLFVNEVLNDLGVAPTPTGQLVGWWASDGDYLTWELDTGAPDDLIVINLMPAGFIWNKL